MLREITRRLHTRHGGISQYAKCREFVNYAAKRRDQYVSCSQFVTYAWARVLLFGKANLTEPSIAMAIS
jgi:hypothetical protein